MKTLACIPAAAFLLNSSAAFAATATGPICSAAAGVANCSLTCPAGQTGALDASNVGGVAWVVTFSCTAPGFGVTASGTDTISPAGDPLVALTINGTASDDDIDLLGLAALPNASLTVVVNGGAGNDIIEGSANDRVTYSETLNGDEGHDVILGRNGVDVLTGGPGSDYLNGGAADDVVFGNTGRDVIRGGLGDDQLIGGPGNDAIAGDQGMDLIDGAAGNDVLCGDEPVHVLAGTGEAFFTTVVSFRCPNGDDVGPDLMQGGTGDDFMYGQADADAMCGDGGNLGALVAGTSSLFVCNPPATTDGDDHMEAGTEVDTMDGQNGSDVLCLGAADVGIGGPADDLLIQRFPITALADCGADAGDALEVQAGDPLPTTVLGCSTTVVANATCPQANHPTLGTGVLPIR